VAEIEQLAHQLRLPPGDNNEKIQQLKVQLFETEARRKVGLGLLISKLAASQGIQADEQRVRARLNTIAATYQEPAEVLRWYEQTPNALDKVRSLVLEEQIVDWVLERAQVTDRASSLAEIMTPTKQAEETPAESAE
jgi:trigger factor